MAGFDHKALEYEGDPAEWAKAIWDRVSEVVPRMVIGGSDVLVAVWVPAAEQRLKGSSLFIPEKTKDEGRFQGVTGLVLKLGPLAYQTEKTLRWFVNTDREPAPPLVGEWVQFDFKQGTPFLLRGQPCRYVADQYILARIPQPDLIA